MTNPHALPAPNPRPMFPGLPPQAIALLQRGGSVTYQDAWVITIRMPDAPVNHTLHAMLTVFTCGAWLPVWLIMAVAAPKGRQITIPKG